MMKVCELCKGEFNARVSKIRFCSPSCASKHIHNRPEMREFYSTKLREAHQRNPRWQQAQAERMKRNNPMHNSASYEKAVAKIRAMGCRPIVRGGNGTGPSKAEWQLMRMFPESVWNYAIKTGMKAGSGYPQCYKADVAFPGIKLAIEADGGSHNNPARRAKDKKKQEFLERVLGWKVLRFSNKQILDFRTQLDILRDVEFIISTLKDTPVIR
jgi:hypothetical protein